MAALKILSLIKRQDEPLSALEGEYLKRIRRFVSCDLVQIKRERVGGEKDFVRVRRAELLRIEKHIPRNSFLVVLDSQGKQYNSQELAVWLKEKIHSGARELVFVLGGPLGLSGDVIQKAAFRLSLSRLTFPHKIARLILIEALYRSVEIMKGNPYHK